MRMEKLFEGVYCVSVTAFKEDESLDEERTTAHLDRVIKAGVDGVIIGGSTGEFAGLSEKERERLLRVGIEHVKGKVPVLAGGMAPSTRETIRWCRFAEDAGADGLMIVSPYYGVLTDEGLYQHFKAVSEAVHIPIMPYNNVETSGNDLNPDLLVRLTENCKNIQYIKECVDTRRIQNIIHGTKGKMKVFTGVDDLLFPGFLLGAVGVVSGAANIAPAIAAKLHRFLKEKNIEEARDLWYKYLPLANLAETSKLWISYIKAGCEMVGDPVGKPRRPLMSASEEMKQKLRRVLKDLELI